MSENDAHGSMILFNYKPKIQDLIPAEFISWVLEAFLLILLALLTLHDAISRQSQTSLLVKVLAEAVA